VGAEGNVIAVAERREKVAAMKGTIGILITIQELPYLHFDSFLLGMERNTPMQRSRRKSITPSNSPAAMDSGMTYLTEE